MPAKNTVKQYLENGFYHIYNRGVEKRVIFQVDQDYKVFLSYLKEYLEPCNKDKLRKILGDLPYTKREKIIKRFSINNFSKNIDLLAFCLMPNHFHLLIKQRSERAIEGFMRSLGTRYVMYFNKRYDRVGHLFQGIYKAALVDSDEQLVHLSRYIHKNPLLHKNKKPSLALDLYSSLPAYLGNWQAKWLKPDEVLSLFSNTSNNSSYKTFMNEDAFEELEQKYFLDL